ncbi:MAG: phosphatase PAP2 family protein, partial [Novosphingobium sp.]|nr:phosphatase PAP2 family protein [Novosphingobium sp.]
AGVVWHPLTRDGGAILARAFSLFDLTSSRDKRLLSYAQPGGDKWLDLDDNPMPEPSRSIFGDFGKSAKRLGKQASAITGDTLLLGGGLVLASAILDKPVDRWTQRHQIAKWNALGKAANAIPLALAAGAGLLWTGLGDDMAAETAWTSIKASALTLATGTLTKLAVGRARPYKDEGVFHFSGFNRQAANSGFPSDHMGIAFALVTPFAQQYDANWLYAIAGATAFGRIQQRQHFVSDTVAGSLIGYGIGSLLLDQQRTRRGARITVGPDRSLRAYWEFD